MLPLPPCSPDINPIELLRGILVRHVYAENRQYQVTEGSCVAVFGACDGIQKDILASLVGNMPNRAFELITSKEGSIRY